MCEFVIWDWNGTLLDDTDAVVAALNDMLTRRSLPLLTRERYREIFSFPANAFYERIGFRIEQEDWEALAVEYHTAYASHPKALNPETIAALERVRASGARQAILSAHPQSLLLDITRRLGVAPYMDYVYGVDNMDGASKLGRARELLVRIRTEIFPDLAEGEMGGRIVMIGDAIHDKEVADALGVGCVLCAQGGHSFERLARVAPTAATLLEAVRIVFNQN